MTQDEIIEMAQECGLVGMRPHLDGIYVESLVAFAKLVAEKALAQPEQEPVACDGDFPEGFDASLGVPAQALRVANAIMCDVIGKREWDVPCTAQHVLSFAKKYTTPPQRTEQCNYPDCKCPTENPCLKGLAQPEQEPVAMVESVATVVSESGNKEVTMSWWHEPALPVGTKLYTHPSQNVIDKSAAKRIATTLGWEPKRGWVDVPDEEIKILWIQYRAAMPRYLCFAKALLARSKENNNA